MVDAASIREHMSVIGSDGQHVGTVDHVEGTGADARIKLTKDDSRDGSHHYIPLTQVARVDSHVHLSVPAISAVPGGAGPAAGTTAAGVAGLESPLPATLNRAVEGATPRRNFYLPWIVGAIGLLLLLLLFRSCVDGKQHETTAPAATEQTTTTVTDNSVVAETPGAPASIAGLGSYLAGVEPTPRTFEFQRINFDTGRSEIRAADRGEIDQVAGVLKQYGTSRVRIAGFADARGSAPANQTLGQARAEAVKAALVAKGIDAGRIETGSGGEDAPVDTNATEGGRFENRRTELVVTAR